MPVARFVVRGRVQGVGFRAYVVQQAELQGWNGEVWNRRDGAVELIVEAPDTAIVAEVLKAGPGWVQEVFQDEASSTTVGFHVGPTR